MSGTHANEKIEIEDIRRLDIRPGDVLVLRTSMKLSNDAVALMRETIEPIITPLGAKVLVLDGGMGIDVVAAA